VPLSTVAAWGSSFLCTQVLMSDGGFSPVEMYSYRFAVAYIILLCFTFKKILSDNLRDELNFLMCGICAGSLYFITENFALQNTMASNVSLLSSISPIFTTILMSIIFKTSIKAGTIVGSIIAFIGVGCVIFSHGEGFEIRPLGDMLSLAAALSWAIYTIVVKRLLPRYSSLFITRKLFFYGVLTSLPLLFSQVPLETQAHHISILFSAEHPQYLFNFLFLVVFCSLVAYLLWNEVMKALGPVMANNYLYGQPLVTMIASYLILGDHIYPLGYIGCIFIIGGLIISDKWKSSIRFTNHNI